MNRVQYLQKRLTVAHRQLSMFESGQMWTSDNFVDTTSNSILETKANIGKLSALIERYENA